MPDDEPFLIEPATLEDIPALVRMLSELFSIESDFHPDHDKQTRGLTLLIHSPHAAVLVARDHSRHPVAMVTAQLVISTAQGAPSAWVEDVFVAALYRHHGLGKQMLAAAESWAKSRGATRMQLLVDLDNIPAVDFYAHLGWQTTRLAARRKMMS